MLQITSQMEEARDAAIQAIKWSQYLDDRGDLDVSLVHWYKDGYTREAICLGGIEVAWRVLPPSGLPVAWTLPWGTPMGWFKRLEREAMYLLPVYA